MNIKCIGCYDLLRVEMTLGGLVAYNCPRFPYVCTLNGLFRPRRGILKAVNDCPEDPLSHCILCSDTNVTYYGENIVTTCKEHYYAWSKWLDAHPGWRDRIAPKGRVKKANWVEVFREFIEDIRQSRQ